MQYTGFNMGDYPSSGLPEIILSVLLKPTSGLWLYSESEHCIL